MHCSVAIRVIGSQTVFGFAATVKNSTGLTSGNLDWDNFFPTLRPPPGLQADTLDTLFSCRPLVFTFTHPMTMQTPFRVWFPASFIRRHLFALLTCLLVSFPALAAAQETTGTITGRVFKPGREEYVRDAEVRLSGTSLVTGTDADGFYTFTNVPAGPATVITSFAGYETARTQVEVVAGQTVTQDINLYTAEQRTAVDEEQAPQARDGGCLGRC